ncbi:MAG: adenylosuccinate synthase [Planctomycetota bacterium]
MARTATITGLQWGDEGKGKVIDALAAQAEMVVRYQGGGNAGHTVIAEGKKRVFHLVPTGILYPGVTCVIGNGAVVDLPALRHEIDGLAAQGIDLSSLRLSSRAHVVFPYHKSLDEARESLRPGDQKIGTTKRGIGPCYADKAARTGIRVADLYQPQSFGDRLRRALDEKNAVLTHLFRFPALEFAPIRDAYLQAADALRPYVCDTTPLVHDALDAGKKILFEGAQGVMLDIDHGTYPFVTSSSASSGGVAAGAGAPPAAVGQVLGIAKAYTTRVGSGPFPSELHGEAGDRLREQGQEYGATTGRPRRCGWLDLVQLRYAVRLTGTTGVVLTKLDTLAGLGPVQVVRGYRRGGQALAGPPAHEAEWAGIELETETLAEIPAGFDYAACRRFEDLPGAAQDYVRYVEQALGVPVSMVSTGPAREALIQRGQPVFAV